VHLNNRNTLNCSQKLMYDFIFDINLARLDFKIKTGGKRGNFTRCVPRHACTYNRRLQTTPPSTTDNDSKAAFTI